jgi:hypothetical protein
MSLEVEVNRQHELFPLTNDSSRNQSYSDLRPQQQRLKEWLELLPRPACDTTDLENRFIDLRRIVCPERTARAQSRLLITNGASNLPSPYWIR